MHTIELSIKEFGEVRVHHNSDWSGEAIIDIPGKDGVRFPTKVTVPGRLILALGIRAAKDHLKNDLVTFLEMWPR